MITNAGYVNPNFTGFVYIAGWAPDEGESLNDYVTMFQSLFVKLR